MSSLSVLGEKKVFLPGDGDPVDARYVELALVELPAAHLQSAVALLSRPGLCRPEGDRYFNEESPRITNVGPGLTRQVTIRCPATAGVTRSGRVLAVIPFECTVELPQGCRAFDLFLLETPPSGPERPVPPPVLIPARYTLSAKPDHPEDALLVGHGSVAGDGIPVVDPDFVPPCSQMDSHQQLVLFAAQVQAEVRTCYSQVRESYRKHLLEPPDTPSARASQEWRSRFISGYRSWQTALEPSMAPRRFLRLAWQVLETHLEDLAELGLLLDPEPSSQELGRRKEASLNADNLGQALRELLQTVRYFRARVGECLSEEIRGSLMLRAGKPSATPSGVWTEIVVPLQAPLGEEMERLQADSVRVALVCTGPEGEDNLAVPVHPSVNVARISRRPKLCRNNGKHQFTFRPEPDDTDYAKIRFFIRKDLVPNPDSLTVEGVKS